VYSDATEAGDPGAAVRGLNRAVREAEVAPDPLTGAVLTTSALLEIAALLAVLSVPLLAIRHLAGQVALTLE